MTIVNSLSTMDVQVTLQLSTNPEVGLLLPCNITVRRSEGRCIVQALDHGALLGVAARNPRQLTAMLAIIPASS